MTDAKRQRCIVYVRQSLARAGETEETSLSLEAQESRLKAYAETQGWIVAQAIRDHDVSGNDPQRPGMQDLMALAKDRAADIILVFAMSRFARDQVWQEIAFRQLRAYGLRVVSVNEPNIEHTLFRGVLGVVNQYASEQTAQFVRASFAARVERGLYHGRPPFGYRKVDKLLVIDDQEAAIVRRIYELWLGGAGVPSINETINSEGGPPRFGQSWSDTTTRQILRNPVYAGYTQMHGKVMPGLHEPIIAPDEWDRAQAIRAKRPAMRHIDRPSWCEGLVYHSCGSRMYLVPHRHPKQAAPTWEYVCQTRALPKSYQCDHPRPRVVFWKLEPAVREAFARDIAGRFDLADVTAIAEQRAGGTEVEVARRAIEKKRAAANDRLKRAEALYLAGKRDAVWLAGEEERLGSTLSAIDTEIDTLPAPVNHDALRSAALMLESLEDQIPEITGNDLRLAIELIAVIVVGEAGASLRYADEIAPFLGTPAVVPFVDGVAPHWVANGGRPKMVRD